jgi:hypothetical protein
LVTVADLGRRNSKELATVCRRKLFRVRRLRQAEGTGVEPATGKPAPDFESDADCVQSRGNQRDARVVGANAGAVESNAQDIDDDLQAVIEAWSRLPDAVRTAIRVIIQNV